MIDKNKMPVRNKNHKIILTTNDLAVPASKADCFGKIVKKKTPFWP